jgi:hypothetical protein
MRALARARTRTRARSRDGACCAGTLKAGACCARTSRARYLTRTRARTRATARPRALARARATRASDKDKESHDDQGTNNGKRKGSVLGKEKKGSDKDKSKKRTYSVLGGVHAIVFSGMLTGFYGVDCEDPNNINAIKLKILNITGWSSEKMISLRFNGTVVCRYGGFTCHHYNVKKEAELDLAVGG